MKRVDQPMINSFLNELKGASHEQSTGKYITRAQYKVTMSDNGRTRKWTTTGRRRGRGVRLHGGGFGRGWIRHSRRCYPRCRCHVGENSWPDRRECEEAEDQDKDLEFREMFIFFVYLLYDLCLYFWPMFTYCILPLFCAVLSFFFFTHCNVNVCHHSVNVNLVFCNQSHTYTSYEVKCITLVITPKPHFTSKCPFEVHYSIANMTNEFDCLIRTHWHND